jgi:hypothetical protein
MIRRVIVLASMVGAGWLIYTRFFRQQPTAIGDTADLRPDDQRGGLADRVSAAFSSAASTAGRAAQAPVEKVRSMVGGQQDETPEGERLVVPEGSADEDTATEMASGYAPADERREPPPTPDAYRPAAEASPLADTTAGGEPGAGGTTQGAETAQPPDGGAQAAAPAAAERTIKGNVRTDGEKIYHLPGDPSYERTNAERWFESVAEAEAAGFRRAGRPREA